MSTARLLSLNETLDFYMLHVMSNQQSSASYILDSFSVHRRATHEQTHSGRIWKLHIPRDWGSKVLLAFLSPEIKQFYLPI